MQRHQQGFETTEELHTNWTLKLCHGRCLTIVATEAISVRGNHKHDVQVSPSATCIPKGLPHDTATRDEI